MNFKKTVCILMFGILMISLFNCRGQKEKTLNANVNWLPNPSDLFFSDALLHFESNERSMGLSDLKLGMVALEKEGAQLDSIYKKNFTRATDSLNLYITRLDKGEIIPLNNIREAIANAQINTTHSYLAVDYWYRLEK